jgi:sporulation protein YlmC with PRC-barrel domain
MPVRSVFLRSAIAERRRATDLISREFSPMRRIISRAKEFLGRSVPQKEIPMRKSIVVFAAATVLAGGAIAAAAPPQFVTLQKSDMLSSNVVGLDVYDSANHNVGTIKDIAFDSSKAVKGYILSVGGGAWHGRPLRRGRFGIRGDQIRSRRQEVARQHGRFEGAAPSRPGIPVRRRMERQQKLSGRTPVEHRTTPSSPAPAGGEEAQVYERAIRVARLMTKIATGVDAKTASFSAASLTSFIVGRPCTAV